MELYCVQEIKETFIVRLLLGLTSYIYERLLHIMGLANHDLYPLA